MAAHFGLGKLGFNPAKSREALSSALATCMETLLALRAWLAVRTKDLFESQIGTFMTQTLPAVAKRVLPSQSTLKSISELLMLSANVWGEAICRIFKLQFSVLLHALWRQGLVIAHSFTRLNADTSIVPNTPILERRRAELRAKSAAHDVKSFRAKMNQLQAQMSEASARLREAEADADEAVRRLSSTRYTREREDKGMGGCPPSAGGVTRVSLGASPRRSLLRGTPSEKESQAEYDWRMGSSARVRV